VSSPAERAEAIAERLDAIASDLAELAIDVLRGAIAERRVAGRPVEERHVTQARRAVEKATHLLRRIGEDAESADS
jgi:hypothetical protein